METLISDLRLGGDEAALFAWVEKTLETPGVPRVTGAISWADPLAAQIFAFRRRENQNTAPHLLSDQQEKIEEHLDIDARSLHFAAFDGEDIVASIRLTPRPFETGSLPISQTLNLTELGEHYEFSRLTTRMGYSRKAVAAKQLLLGCGLWLFQRTTARGIFGICARDREPFFLRFGVCAREADTPFQVEGRGPTNYRLVRGERSRVLDQIRQFLSSRRSVNAVVAPTLERRWT